MALKVGPDKGWSWVVASAACFSSLILAGIFRTSGVLFVAFIGTFGVSRQAASWPMVVCISVLNLAGPICGILGQRFGARPVIITGALIATVGISSCYFTTSLNVITVLFGGVFGVGYGFMNTVMPGILNAYFLDLRATANGIANAGSCVGSIVLPILFEYFITTYGLSGCFLLTGGIVLHITIAGALMRNPPWMEKTKTKIETDKIPPAPQNEIALTKIEPDFEEQEMSMMLNQEVSLMFQPTGQRFDQDIESSPMPNEFKHVYSSIKDRKHSSNDKPTMEDDNDQEKQPPLSNPEKVTAHNAFGRLLKRISCDSFNNDSPFFTIIHSFGEVLTCPMFFITAITNVCFYFLYHMYVVIIVDYALDRNVPDSDAKHMLFAFSLADLFGRLCLGWVTDKKLVSRSRFLMSCMVLIGLVFFVFPFADSYWPLIAVSSSYGLLLGCTMVIFPILLVDYLGIELHSVSYGCMCFMNGLASFGRPFLIGYFRDNVGSYANMFYVLGALSLASASLWLLEVPFQRLKRSRHDVV